MKLRIVNNLDCMDLFEWRNDTLTRKMSIDSNLISLDNHKKWFKDSLNNENRKLFIAEVNQYKIGMCRFDYDSKKDQAEVSINLNPKFRGKGYGKKLLLLSLENYLKKRELTIVAKIKIENIKSFNMFSSAGFNTLKKGRKIIKMELRKNLVFKPVNDNDVDILYELIKNRNYSISHEHSPDYTNHKKFVMTNPYLHWYLIHLGGKIIGTFYIKEDNSIGININNFTYSIIKETLIFIIKNFNPQKSVPSVIPKFFYINVPSKNIKLIKTLNLIGLVDIQVSFKIDEEINNILGKN